MNVAAQMPYSGTCYPTGYIVLQGVNKKWMQIPEQETYQERAFISNQENLFWPV
jgi:hypothetical protein